MTEIEEWWDDEQVRAYIKAKTGRLLNDKSLSSWYSRHRLKRRVMARAEEVRTVVRMLPGRGFRTRTLTDKEIEAL